MKTLRYNTTNYNDDGYDLFDVLDNEKACNKIGEVKLRRYAIPAELIRKNTHRNGDGVWVQSAFNVLDEFIDFFKV